MTAVVPDVAHVAPSPDDAAPASTSAPGVPGAGWLAVGAVASKGAQTAVLLAFAAVLDPASFGVVALGAVLFNATTVVADLGTATALVHFRGDAERAARTAVTIALATSLGLVVTVWIAAPWLSGVLHAGDLGADVFRGIVLCVPIAAVAGVSGELLRRALDFRRRVLPDIAGNAIGAAVTITALAAGEGAFSLVYGQLVQVLVVLLAFWWLRPRVLPGWSRDDAGPLVSYGAGLAGGGLLTLVMLNVDYVLIANRLGVSELGVYSMAFRVAYMPYLLIAMVIGGAAFAHLCRLRGAAAWRATVDAARVLHVIAVPAYVGVAVLAPQIQLLGDQWAPAVPALRWLAVYGLALSALELLLVSLKSAGRTSDVFGLGALHLGVLLVLLLIYVDRGVTAVAAAQLVAGLVTLLAACAVLTRRVPGTEWRLLLRRLAPIAAAAVAMAVTAVVLQELLPWQEVSAATLVVVGTTATASYLAALLVLDRDLLAVTARLGRLPLRRAGLYGAVVAVALVAGALAVAGPHVVLLVVLGVAALVATTVRVEWAALVYVAAEPFGDLLRDIHPAATKALGALLFLSWLARLAREPRTEGLRHPGIVTLGALMAALLASLVASGADLEVGRDHTVTYASYALLVVVLVDSIRRGRPDPTAFARRLGLVLLASCTAAGAVAIVDFVLHGGRGSGPLTDPNDLAFFMVAALPFALLGLRRGSRTTATTVAAAVCGTVLVLAVLVTLSRGALVGLAVMAVIAVVIGAVPLRAVAGVGVLTAVALSVLWLTSADVIDRSLQEKSHVAAANVDLRVTSTAMAAEMTAESPFFGQGPGGFERTGEHFAPDGTTGVEETVAHQMYLDVSAELGLVGLAAFLGVLGFGIRGAARAARRRLDDRSLPHAVLLGLAGTLTAACFLSEQFYLPVWLLVALGLAMDPGPATRRTEA